MSMSFFETGPEGPELESDHGEIQTKQLEISGYSGTHACLVAVARGLRPLAVNLFRASGSSTTVQLGMAQTVYMEK